MTGTDTVTPMKLLGNAETERVNRNCWDLRGVMYYMNDEEFELVQAITIAEYFEECQRKGRYKRKQ